MADGHSGNFNFKPDGHFGTLTLSPTDILGTEELRSSLVCSNRLLAVRRVPRPRWFVLEPVLYAAVPHHDAQQVLGHGLAGQLRDGSCCCVALSSQQNCVLWRLRLDGEPATPLSKPRPVVVLDHIVETVGAVVHHQPD